MKATRRDRFSVSDLEKHLAWLRDSDLMYHLDDDPGDIGWSREPSAADLARLVEAHASMWRSFDQHTIWEAVGRIWPSPDQGEP